MQGREIRAEQVRRQAGRQGRSGWMAVRVSQAVKQSRASTQSCSAEQASRA
jgi:hypothetical protein